MREELMKKNKLKLADFLPKDKEADVDEALCELAEMVTAQEEAICELAEIIGGMTNG